MRTLSHQNHKSFIQWKHMTRVTCSLDHAFQLKIVCDDGELFCDRLLFILWSKHWREILDPNEEESVLIFPGVKKRSMMLLLKLLMVGDTGYLHYHHQNHRYGLGQNLAGMKDIEILELDLLDLTGQ